MRVQEAARLVPTGFAERVSRLQAEGGPTGAEWVATLPQLITQVLDDWSLQVDGPATTGRCALVLPVRGDGSPAALKLGWPHAEAEGEHLALRAWDGHCAVRLLSADPHRSTLLLERLTTQDLTESWDEEAVAEVAGLYGALHTDPLPRLPTLLPGVAEVLARPTRRHLPRQILDRAGATLRSLEGEDVRLLHGDLHYRNVLSDGTDWVAIDPKPVNGHPAWEVAPLLSNRVTEMGTGASLRWSVRRRVEVVCEVAGLDEDIVRPVCALREVVNAIWAVEDDDPDRVSLAISIIKALGD